ncbi:LLM class flavin-dependent oxidoreductase [Cellulomonas hominis]|uniref:LLM class flavin-dependent oxidoreductase n=1 Tax=Cellulomonas hominis TaxID=156981 RepID=UPI001B9C92EF|nr:LLM class flavin-dependent oxidoreductase [Cellulomonas hominis]VTR76821.1 Alkanal monooxygenase alpha chain [Cellulomonas hominis]
MELGLYTFGDVHPDPVSGARTSPAQRLRDILERVRLAEQVGLDHVGVGEHHRPDYAVSSPSTVIAAALAQTERISVGSAVTVLSTEDPVRVYQQFATMDLLSGGRVELLAGRGSFIESYPLFGASLDDYDALFDEKIRLLLRIDRGNPVTWSGRFRAPLHAAEILPRPTDKPGLGEHLRIAVATGGNPASSERAGRLGLPVSYAIIGGRPADFAGLVRLYRRAHEEAGHDAATRRVEVAGMGFVAEDGRAARDFFFPYWLDSMRRIAAERGFAVPNRIAFESQSAKGGAYFVGAPEEVAERIVALHGVLGHDRQIFQMDLSGVPQRESLRAIELLGTRVAPMVREALAG